MSERELFGVIEEAAREGAWRAAAWLLEWRRTAARENERPAPKAPEPETPRDPFAEVDELARRRRGA